MLLTPTQPKILALKISHFVPHCTNEYVKEKEEKEEKEEEEKEKNTTIFTKWNEELPMTMREFLFNNTLV